MNRPIVLVLGANGRFGAAAVRAFAAAGWQVHAQVRRAPASPLPPGVMAIETPLYDIETLTAHAAGASVVVYGVNPLYTRWDEEALPLARLGMNVAERLGALFMLPGNVYNFGEHMPVLLRPDTPQAPTTTKGHQRCELEAEIQVRSTQDRLRGAVIRAGDFFGASSGNWFDQAIVKDIAKGRLTYPGPLDVAHAWAYLPDLAQAFVAVASLREQRAFQSFHFAGHTCTGVELLAELETAATDIGLRPATGFSHRSMPWGLIRAVGVVHPLWRELARMSYLWRVPHALDGSALRAAAGPLEATPLRDALRRSLIHLGFASEAVMSARPAMAERGYEDNHQGC